MSTAVAYLRRSRVDTARPGSVSHEAQLHAVRELARRHGDDPEAMVILEDWGRSGRAEKQHLRRGFADLEAMVRDGEATAVYAYSLSRLGRSIEVVSRLAKACKVAKVPIRCATGDSPDVSTSSGRLILNILVSVNEWQAEWTQERAEEAAAIRRARGDHMGPAPFGFRVRGGQLEERDTEDPSIIIAAYRTAGTYQGAAKLLTAQSVPTRAGRPWNTSSVRAMLLRMAPDELPIRPKRGRPPVDAFRLAGLLRCPCGATLTGRHYRSDRVSYECKRAGILEPHHPRPRSVVEPELLPWIRVEAALLRGPGSVALGEPEAPERRERLEATRRRVIEAFMDGLIDKVERDARLLAIADELEQLASVQRIAPIPTIDWTWPPAELNAVLRAMWAHVELGPDLRPIRAAWLVPEWRA